MKKFRLLSLVTALCVFCSVLSVNAQVDTDVAVTPIQTQAFEAMKSMDLVTEDFLNIDENAPVTRAQFIGALYKLTGIGNVKLDVELPFDDVDVNNKYRDAISFFYNIGAVSGNGNKKFNPDEYITYTQAVKVISDLLGYKVYVEDSLGGFPNGYLAMAVKLGLDDGLSISNANGALLAKGAITLLYNAALAPMGEVVAYKPNGKQPTYTIAKDKTLLSVYNSIYYSEGIVENNGVVSMDDGSSTPGIAVVDGKKYKLNAVDLVDYLGMDIKFFYKSVDGTDEFLWVCPGEYNEVLTIRSEDLITNDKSYGISKIVYYKNDKEETVSIDKFADIVYNNAISNNPPIEYLKPKSGEIKLINNDGDKDYDIVIVKEYTNVFVDSISVTNKYITNKYGDALELDLYENVKIFDETGKVIEIDELAPGRVISYVANPENKDFIHIYENKAGVSAVFTSLFEDGEHSIYNFEGNTFKLSSSLNQAISSGKYHIPELEIGKTYTYYTDMDGYIAAIKLSGIDEEYAYFVEALPCNDPFAPKGSYEVKILLADNTMAYVTTSKDFKTAGYDDKVSLVDKKPQVVKALFNGSGELKQLEFATPLDRDAYPFGYNKDEFTLDYAPSKAYVRNDVFNNSYSVNGNTLVFATLVDDAGEEVIQVITNGGIMTEKTYTSFWRGSVEYSAPKFYDVDEYMHANVMSICIGYGGYVDRGSNMLVDEVVRYIDDNGTEGVKIKGLKGYTESEFVITDKGAIETAKKLKRGDIVAASVFNNRVYRLEKVFSMREDSFTFLDETEAEGNGYWTTSIASGYLYSNDGANISLYNPNGWVNGKKILVSSTQNNWSTAVSIYDARTDTIYPGRLNEVYQNCAPHSDGTIDIDEHSTRVYMVRRLGYTQNIIIAYY